jgi:hypothetical protein
MSRRQRKYAIEDVAISIAMIVFGKCSRTVCIHQHLKSGEVRQSDPVDRHRIVRKAPVCHANSQFAIPELHHSGQIVVDIRAQSMQRLAQ